MLPLVEGRELTLRSQGRGVRGARGGIDKVLRGSNFLSFYFQIEFVYLTLLSDYNIPERTREVLSYFIRF